MENTINKTLEHVLFLARYLRKRDVQVVISSILLDMGFIPNGAGYQYLKTAIQLFHDDPTQLVTHGLYVEVARKYGRYTSWMQVERSIRRVLHIAWDDHDPATWRLYLPSVEPDGRHGYRASTFIAGIAEILIMWEGCCEKEKMLSEEVVRNEATE